MSEVVIEQQKGFYKIVVDGREAKLTRVTTMLDWVLKDAVGAMSYYGGKLFSQWLGEDEGDWEDLYTAWKASEWEPNKQLRKAAQRGTNAHQLFEKLLNGDAKVTELDDGKTWVADAEIDFVPVAWDLGAVRAYRNLYSHHDPSEYVSEARLFWTEHPIPECPEPDKQDRCTHGFSGTCDVLWPKFGRIDDLKTHQPGYRFSEHMQMALYSLAAQQQYGIDVTQQRIVLALEDGTYALQDERFLPARAGLLLYDLFKLRKEWGPKS